LGSLIFWSSEYRNGISKTKHEIPYTQNGNSRTAHPAKGEKVKESYEELQIANWLYEIGVATNMKAR